MVAQPRVDRPDHRGGLDHRDRLSTATEILAAAESRAAEGGLAEGEPAGGRATRGRATRGRARSASAPARTEPPPDPASNDSEPDPHEVARAIVLRQLSMAPSSRRQLADRLRQRGCPDDVATRVLDRMAELGLVDDDAYAAMVVRSKQAGRGLAKRALAHELRGKGVADETIAAALRCVDAESERALAEQVAVRTMRRLAGLEPAIQARRLAGVLHRKGYPPSVVYPVVRDAVNDAREHRRD